MSIATEAPPRKQPPRLERLAFRSSRLLEFCSEKELTLQTGHPASDWPLVVVKELIDNALDACEEAGIAPVIEVAVDGNSITVTDNGPGLPEATLDGVLDYTSRTSSREAYVSPTRGAQGNALKTVLAMPYALAGAEQRGKVEIEAHCRRHVIEFAVDHIRQEPAIRRSVESCDRQMGTSVRVHWPVSPRSDLERAQGAIFTNRRRLHLAQPAPEPDPWLARRPTDAAGDDAGLGQVAPLRTD
jgi:DNA topoisomerase VI subunit B